MSQSAVRGVAVVTGAAGGMGSACAVQLAAQGWPLLLCDLHPAPLEEAAARLRASGTEAAILAGDIAAADFPAQLAAAIGEQQVGAFIHTAGLSPTMADGPRILAVNYDATVRLVDVVRPRMAEGGCAVLIASSSAYFLDNPQVDAALNALQGDDSSPLLKMGAGPEFAYPASKRGVIRLVARQAPAFGERKARIMSISPGLIDTGMSRQEAAASPQMAMMLEKTPLSRLGVADEIASVAVFLCSPAASYVSGIDILVDGGMMAALQKLPGQSA